MWVYLPLGMVSIVADKDDPMGSPLLVRARRREHLEAFVALADDPVPKLKQTPHGDYLWRVRMEREAVSRRLVRMAHGMDYSNFKGSIPQQEGDYHDACLGAWQSIRRIQR
jgi:hypothetical protein